MRPSIRMVVKAEIPGDQPQISVFLELHLDIERYLWI